MTSETWKRRLDIATSVATLCVCAAIVWTLFLRNNGSSVSQGALPREPISLQGAPTMGEPTAPVALLVFTDYQCPFCANFAENILPELKRRYIEAKRLLVAVRGIQGSSSHTLAEVAERVGSCAASQGRFWPYHDGVFALKGLLTLESIRKTAELAGLSAENVERCLTAQHGGSFEANTLLAKTLRIHATPWFFLGHLDQNGQLRAAKVLVGLRSLDEFTGAIDAVLASTTP
jgi:protein-disulfide isomerase